MVKNKKSCNFPVKSLIEFHDEKLEYLIKMIDRYDRKINKLNPIKHKEKRSNHESIKQQYIGMVIDCINSIHHEECRILKFSCNFYQEGLYGTRRIDSNS